MASGSSRLACLFFLWTAACSSSDDAPSGRADDQATRTRDATVPKRADSGAKASKPDASLAPTGDAEAARDAQDVEDAGAPDKSNDDPVGDAAAGLPCDVQAVLSRHCWQCHDSSTKFGAPFSLVTQADLAAPVAARGGKPRAALALARVQDDASPMPPAPNARLSAQEVETLQRWVDAGFAGADERCDSAADAGTDNTGAGATIPMPSDCENSYELKAHGGSGSTDTSKFKTSATPALEGNQYQCFYFDPPYGDDQVMYWFDSILDNLGALHHWILYGTDDKTHSSGSTEGCNAAEPGSYFIAGWAPGGTNGAAAGDVALQLPTGPRAGLILEVHYYNNTGTAQADASGIKFCTGKAAGRKHLAAVHTLGSEGICIQPGSKKEVSGDCAPRTDMGDSHITGIWPHMHKSARHMKVSIKRKDGTVEVIHDEPFDFNAQIFYPMKQDVVVHPGDKVETVCSYQNETSSAIHYGERTQDEMCYAFTAAWPAGSLANAPSGLSDPSTTLFNHCQSNQLSILQSCNGLQDRPVNVSHP
jgi:Copper type II ascorbate-dependent monooxygenase, C-terminal domain